MAELLNLTNLIKTDVTGNHYLLVADSSKNTAQKYALTTLFPSVVNAGTGQAIFKNITNQNQINFKGITSGDTGLLTVATATNDVVFTVLESGIDLSACNNATSEFLSGVDFRKTVTSQCPVINGGTGLSTIAKGAILYASATDTIAATAAMSTNGQILIGNTTTGVPTVARLTAGASGNVTITNDPGAITIEATLSTMAAILDMANFNVDLGTGYISSDGTTDQGIRVTGPHTYLGDVGAYHDSDILNIGGGGIRFSNESTVNIKPNANTGTTAGSSVRVQAGDSVDGNAGNLELHAGSATGTGIGGSVIITGGRSTGGSVDGDISINTYTGASRVEALKVHHYSQDVEIPAGDLRITNERKGLVHSGSGTVTQATSHTTGVTMNTTSGIITLATASLPAATAKEFVLTNSTITTTSLILLTVEAPEGAPTASDISASIVRPTAGDATIRLFNSGTSATEATTWKVNFLVINI